MVKIPKTLWTHINTAFPNDVCLVATVLPSGYAQITPRGSTLVPLHRGFDGLNDGLHSTQVGHRDAQHSFHEADVPRRQPWMVSPRSNIAM
jgi:hypothetical protein